MNADIWPDRVKRAMDMHPTPLELRAAIFDAIEDHNKAAAETGSVAIPFTAYVVIRKAMQDCTEAFYQRTHNAR